MGQLLFQTIAQLGPTLRAGDLEGCERYVVEQLRQLPRSPFDLSIEAAISNDPSDAARSIDHFIEVEAKRITIAAAYSEMNGFDINPALWFCNFFAYSSYGGNDDYDWLSDWQSSDSPRLVIRGMEGLQAVFASAEGRKKSLRDSQELSGLLVVIRFQQFIRKAVSEMKLLHFPLLAMAHDFDFIAEFRPKATDPSVGPD